MESKSEIKREAEFEKKYFKISYIIIWVIIIALNAVILPLILMKWLVFVPLFASSWWLMQFIYWRYGDRYLSCLDCQARWQEVYKRRVMLLEPCHEMQRLIRGRVSL